MHEVLTFNHARVMLSADYGDQLHEALPREEHPHRERAVPRADHLRAQGRPRHRQRPQQRQQKHHHPLVRCPTCCREEEHLYIDPWLEIKLTVYVLDDFTVAQARCGPASEPVV